MSQLFAQSFALLVDVAVGTATKVDALERAGAQFLGRHYLLQSAFAVFMYYQCLTWQQFMHVVTINIKSCLQHGTLAGQGDDLVVAVVEGGSDAPGVAHAEHLATTRESAHHKTAVVVLHGSAQHVGHLNVVVDIVGNVDARQTLCGGLLIQALHLAVQSVAHQLQGDVRVAVDTWTLALGGQEVEHLVDVGHVKVAAKAQVLGAPVVSAKEGVNKRQPALAGSRVAQVAHQQFALHLLGHATEYLGNGILALRLFAEHVLGSGLVVQVHAGYTGALLSAVVLFLHHQVQLVKTVGPGTVFLLVVIQRLQQANHRHSALMLQLLHRLFAGFDETHKQWVWVQYR